MKRLVAMLVVVLALWPLAAGASELVYRPRAATWIIPYPSAWLSPDGTDMDGQCWDSFLLPNGGTLSAIEWWGADTTGVEAFELSLWPDIGIDLQPYVSGPALVRWTALAPAGLQPDTTLSGWAIDHYTYTLPATYALAPNTWYWLSVRARHYSGAPSWGWAVATNGDSHHFAQVGAYYAGDISFTYQPNELAFRLDGPPPAGVAPATGVAFALEGARPNPARGGRVAIAYTLPTAAPASLELLDVSGRRIERVDAAASGAGRHEIAFGSRTSLAPGVYLARLTQGANARTARVIVVE